MKGSQTGQRFGDERKPKLKKSLERMDGEARGEGMWCGSMCLIEKAK